MKKSAPECKIYYGPMLDSLSHETLLINLAFTKYHYTSSVPKWGIIGK